MQVTIRCVFDTHGPNFKTTVKGTRLRSAVIRTNPVGTRKETVVPAIFPLHRIAHAPYSVTKPQDIVVLPKS
jgi:hypothetical protein